MESLSVLTALQTTQNDAALRYRPSLAAPCPPGPCTPANLQNRTHKKRSRADATGQTRTRPLTVQPDGCIPNLAHLAVQKHLCDTWCLGILPFQQYVATACDPEQSDGPPKP